MKPKSSYSDEETEPLYGPQMREREKPSWDVFEDPPVVVRTGSLEEFKWLEYSVMFAKLLVTTLCFCVVLGSAMVSKGSLLFITSQIGPNISRPYCNQDLARSREFTVTLPDVERVTWMWILIFIFCVPELGTFIRSARICCFKTWRKPNKWEFLIQFLTESLPAIGSAILVFKVLPNLDVIKGAMLTNAVSFIPGCVALFSRNPKNVNSGMELTLDLISIVAQGSSLIVWPLVEQDPQLFTIPLSVLLISIGWWENFVTEDSKIDFISRIAKKKKHFDNSQYFSYLFISITKCILFFGTALLIVQLTEGHIDHLFDHFMDTFRRHTIVITEVLPIVGDSNTPDFEGALPDVIQTTLGTQPLTPLWVFLINILATYICYAFGKWACKIMIQGFSFAFPINLTVPATLSVLIAMSASFIHDSCAFYGVIPSYLFFNVPNVYDLNDFISHQHSWIWLIWLLSQAWITVHIWNPRCERLEKTEKLFMKPMYDAFLIDQSVALNRRRDETFHKIDPDDIPLASLGDESPELNRDTIPRIYACATMWHETKEEMMEFLKSIMRLDEDQCARRNVRNYMGFVQPDYYELETHIMFDDAYVRTHQDDNDPHVNEYVLSLFKAIDAAATEVHRTSVRVRPPKLYVTPYGGRLIWTLPGKTKMYVHLKDKKKIRNKKRWSQVMYMYYLLGHRLMDNDSLSPERKALISEYTFILALDGDIDFQPQAVHLLVNLMKKNRTLGAACGRIHPIGSGPMVWYQMFEYAIGHWLQKSTEHMIGCVLCSPGCFSLFRGEALMDKNVMKKYTTTSELPRHYVQFDQGEDRWLCTLLLQRGYRVEYSAASDAYTHCPESFNEFYNQRRRWMPSTTANIMDLLMDYKRTVKINDNISSFYIIYQAVLMIGTVLGPGTIFLMLVGAFVSAFQLDQWTSFVWNIVPILVFFFVCSLFKSDIQLFFAGILSAIYGLVMMAVLVGIMLQINDDGWLAPSSLFFFVVAGEMIITAFMHPKELNCLKYGVVYYVTVPSMYMLLVIYSVFNMNNVSWGTREVTVVPPPNKADGAKAAAAKPATKQTKKDKLFNFFGGSPKDDSGSVEFSLAGLFKCILCTNNRESNEMVQLKKIQTSVEELSKKVERQSLMQMGSEVTTEPRISRKRTTILDGARASRVAHLATMEVIEDSESEESIVLSEQVEENSWLYDGDLARGEVDYLSLKEENFWNELLGTYLPPIDESDKKDKIAKELKDLRDKVVMAFFMLNALFVLVVFLLTLKKELIHIKWPFGVQYNFTYFDDSGEFRLSMRHLELEPIGFVFLIFFFILMVVQFIAMLLHRFETFSQILSTTTLNFGFLNFNPEKLTEEEILERDPISVAKKLQQLKGADEDDEEVPEEAAGRRKTAFHLAKAKDRPSRKINDLDTAFRRRVAKCIKNADYKGPVRRDTVAAIAKRRDTIMRRQSQMVVGSPHARNQRDIGGNDNPAFIDDNYQTDVVD